MQPINTPLTLGQTGQEVANMQEVLMHFISGNIISITDNELVNRLAEEYAQQLFGSATVDVVRQYQGQHGLPLTPAPVLNEATLQSINAVFGQLPGASGITLSGYIRNPAGGQAGAPFNVTLYQSALDGQVPLGSTMSDAHGYYRFVFGSSEANAGKKKGYQIVAVNYAGETFSSDITYLSGNNLQLDVMVTGDAANQPSEYEDIHSTLTGMLNETAIAAVDVNDQSQMAYLTAETGEQADNIRLIVQANQLHNDLGIDASLLYGLLRQNITAAPEVMLSQPAEFLKRALTVAVSNNIIPALTTAEMDNAIAALRAAIVLFITQTADHQAPEDSATFRILQSVINNAGKTADFMNAYFAFDASAGDSFWEVIADDPFLHPLIDDLKAAISLALLSGNNPAVVNRLLHILKGTPLPQDPQMSSIPDNPQPQLLVNLKLADWTGIVARAQQADAANFFYPRYVTGGDPGSKNESYARHLYDYAAQSFPTQAAAARIQADSETPFAALRGGLESFIQKNPGFDFRTTPVTALAADDEGYDFTGVADKNLFVAEAGAMQRLMNLTPDYAHIAAMAKQGLTSSMQIVQQSQAAFTASMGPAMSAATAAGIYNTARNVATYNSVSLIEMYGVLSVRSTPFVLDNQLFNPQEAYAEWRTLFGSLDGCNCSQCQSVYSPSAYMTDLLRFLETEAGNPAIYGELQNNRRPDIQHIELTCKNANTAIPQIDIVNELLEDLVSTGQYKMYARQTTANAALQRAIPEHVNTDDVTLQTWNAAAGTYSTPTTIHTPYPALIGAKYPWSLPYNFYKRQIDTHLGLSGIKGHEIVRRFSSNDQLQAWDDYAFCTEYLGISKDQADAITIAPATLFTAYGFKANTTGGIFNIPDPASRGASIPVAAGTWIGTLTGRADIFLQQTGLSYTELLQLLDCYSLNPITGPATRKMAIVKNAAGVPYDTCELDKLKIDGMDANVLTLLHRFVRMKRALGWTYYELDKALLGLGITTKNSLSPGAINANDFKQLAQLKGTATMLKTGIEETVILFAPIDTLAYRNYEQSEPSDIRNLYQRIFRNPAVFDINDHDYPFDDAAGFATPVDRDVLQNYLSGILNISGASLRDLLTPMLPALPGGASIMLSLPMLSNIYREALLLKAMKLTVADWLALKNRLSTITLYGTDQSSLYDRHIDFTHFNPMEAIRLATAIRTVQDAGLSTADIDYLLQDKMPDAVADAQLNDTLAKALTDLRSELNKKWSPMYDEVLDTTGEALIPLLQQVMDADKASRLVAVIQGTAALEADYSLGAARDLINISLSFFLPANSDGKLVANVPAGSYEPNAEKRRLYVFNQLDSYMRQTVLKPFIISFLTKEFRLDESMVKTLLEDLIELTAGTPPLTAMEALLKDTFISSQSVINRWAGNTDYDDPFRAMLLLHKAGLLTERFRLTTDDAAYFWKKGIFADSLLLSELPVRSSASGALPAAAPFRKLGVFLRWMQVRAFLGDKAIALYRQLESINTTANAAFLDSLSIIFSTDLNDIKELLDNATAPSGVLNAVYVPAATDYQQPQLYLRIIDALEMQHLLPAPMATLRKIAIAIRNAATQAESNEIIQVVKAQYNDAQWLEVIRPVNDILRIERRDAMLAFLLANPPAPYQYKWYTANDIFETLMIDVEMSPCMPTTRVLLAINSIQLWVDRVLLGLEKTSPPASVAMLKMDKDAVRQWATWRKRYRVWEANRKIFIYPENWIEPELRDGKTPLFTELEKFLKQNEVTAENVEAAYHTYLERLDEVAHLNIVGIYRETKQEDYTIFMYNPDVIEQDTVHVFGRTPAYPHIYYYRRRVLGEWTPWEKMDVQVDGDHFIPVMWRGRLRFYWLTFTKDQRQETATGVRSQDKYVTPPAVRWKMQLAWTEYKGGRWTAKQISSDALYSRYIFQERPRSKDQIDWFAGQPDYRPWNFEGDLEKIRTDYINFFCDFEDGNLRFKLTERVYEGSDDYISYLVSGPLHSYKLSTAMDIVQSDDRHMSDWMSTTGYFTAKFNGVVATQELNGYNIQRSLYSDYAWIAAKIDLPDNNYKLHNTDYWYFKETKDGYQHYPNGNVPLLGRAPGHQKSDAAKEGIGEKAIEQIIIKDRQKSKYLVFPRQVPQTYTAGAPIHIPYFFYKDYNNSFFVEEIHEAAAVNLNAEVTASQSGGDFGILMTPGSGFGFGTGSGATVVLEGSQDDTGGQVLFNPGVLGGGYTVKYRFHNFHHDRVYDFRKKLHEEGLEGLLDRRFISGLNELTDNKIDFRNVYKPTGNVDTVMLPDDNHYPENIVDFRYEGAFATYNWELFFHIPLLIANRLSQNQQFEEARKWYHFVFNPTAGNNPAITTTTTVADFWNVAPFYKAATTVPTLTQIMQDANLKAAVARWANDPFKPHLVARTRISAYMKATVMKYLDNLIAWGDTLFRTDSREDIVEATLLYVLAAQLLGRRPAKIPARAVPVAQTYAMMHASGHWNAFGNALVKIESLMLASGTMPTNVQLPPDANMYYFCIPPNDKLTAYWDIIADRLFKIRHCRNIDGVERELALYDPPIDPALLVKAAAAGISIADALTAINAPLPAYRFQVMSQKATELTGEVKALGSQLLAALEKKDAEGLALLRSSQEMKVLDAVTELKEKGVDEAAVQINGLKQQQIMTTQRRDYYKRVIDNGLNGEEQLQLDSMKLSIPLHIAQGVTQTLASGLFALPEVYIGPFIVGASYGGVNWGNLLNAASAVLGTVANVNSVVGSMAATKGSFTRRREEWELQQKLAETELKQIDQQIAGAEIRRAMAEVELRSHQLQVQNTLEMDEAMRGKYTNEELYDWMTGQISFTYIAAYKLAHDMAKRAERCYQNELNDPLADFIGYGYWDSLHKGLLAGESLAHDIKRMEVSYLEKNRRSLELSKHVSLATLAPNALLQLKTEKHCMVQIPEWLFDLDYPGQHMRRIKSVSVSIPCVAGPYTTVSCRLSLLKSRYRKSTLITDRTKWEDYMESPLKNDQRFQYMYGPVQSIATSHAQNDSGMFEFSFRDERYLPFEGAGAVSEWRIELPAAYAQFNYDSISDVILHINYTALDEGSLAEAAKDYVIQTFETQAGDGFLRLFSLRHEFANEWHAYASAFSATPPGPMTIKLNADLFPFYCAGKQISVAPAYIVLKPKGTLTGNYKLEISYKNGTTVNTAPAYALNAAEDYAYPSKTLAYALPASLLTIDGNTRILKLVLKDAQGHPVNMDALLDDLYLVTLNKLNGAISTQPVDDVDWTGSVAPPAVLPIPANALTGWWMADKGISLVSNAGVDEVSNWADQSGAGNDLVALPTQRPLFHTNGGANNAKFLRFDGTRSLCISNFNLPANTKDITLMMVFKNTDITNAAKLVCELTTDADVNTNGFVMATNNTAYDIVEFGHKGDAGYSLAFENSGGYNWIYLRCEALKSKSTQEARVYVNHSTGGGIAPPFTGNYNYDNSNDFAVSAPFYVGSRANSNYFFIGEISEIIFYTRELTISEINDVKTYIHSKYNL